jgi:hypothetical protein
MDDAGGRDGLAGTREPGGEAAWDDPIWGTGITPSGVEERGGQQQYLELIGDRLRVAGMADLGRFRRLTDYVNMLQGFFTLRSVTLLTRTGEPTRVTMPELRVRLDDVSLVALRSVEAAPAGMRPPSDATVVVEKIKQRLVLMTPAHIVAGDVHIHAGGSLLHFVDSTDPRFIPMSDARVRWLDDRMLVGHFSFALVHRNRILGVATEGLGGAAEAEAARQADAMDEVGDTGDGDALLDTGDELT